MVRCFNKEKNQVKSFERWITEQHGWQNSTGFVPQELPTEFTQSTTTQEPQEEVTHEQFMTGLQSEAPQQATHPPRRSPGRPRIIK